MPSAEHLPWIEVRAASELRDWFAANHATSGSVWLVTHKTTQGAAHVGSDAVVEELLAFGWIDSLPRKLDAARTMLLISPRKPGSARSAVNNARSANLEAAGRLASRATTSARTSTA